MKRVGVIGLLSVVLLACSSPEPRFLYQSSEEPVLPGPGSFPAFPDTSFAHISDIHVYDPSLGTEGRAWEDYLANDRKLLALSSEILDTGLESILKARPRFLVVSGDLTKDGERSSHELVARSLAKLEAAGIPVYVIPGNHDVLNPHSFSFQGDLKVKVDHITPEDFRVIYREMGYSEAIKQDSHSLSYLAEPVPGLWLLALDTAQYETNFADDYPKTAGTYRPQTLVWMEEILREALVKGKAVAVTQHHGLVEHWAGQAKFHSEYLVDHRYPVARMLARYGVRFVLTGHYHSHDAALQTFPEDGTWILDMEVGSLVTWPSPWRLVNLSENQLKYTTSFVDSLPSREDFQPYAKEFVRQGLYGLAMKTMAKYGVPEEEGKKISEASSQAFLAHYYGDEAWVGPAKPRDFSGLGLMGTLVSWQLGYVLDGLWSDTAPRDHGLEMDLTTGEFQ